MLVRAIKAIFRPITYLLKSLPGRFSGIILGTIIVIALITGHFAYKMYQGYKQFAHYTPPPVSVTTGDVEKISRHRQMLTIGSVVAVNGVNIAPQVSGVISKVQFESGTFVHKGDPIIEITHDADEADLLNEEAQLSLAQINYQRNQKLIKTNAISQSDLDASFSKLQQDKAKVLKTKALIAYKMITAPFSGKLGISHINVGEYLSVGTSIVSLQSMDPMYVDFTIPENEVGDLFIGQKIEVRFAGTPKEKFEGKISALDSRVNTDSRSILVRGLVNNPEHKLYPGMFVDVKVIGKESMAMLVVPQTAIDYNVYGNSVYLIEEKNEDNKTNLVAVQRFITLGELFDDKAQIVKGVKEGDRVVTAGHINLHNNTTVIIKNNYATPGK